MSEQNDRAEQTRVTSITVERLFNLGNYENIKYGVRVEIAHGDDPGRILTSVESILNDLRASSGVSDWALERAKRALAKTESELTEEEKHSLDDYRRHVERDEDARKRRERSREALATLNHTSERKDHKQDWDDGDDVEF